MSKITEALSAAIEAVLGAGRRIMTIYDTPDSTWDVEQKADSSPLTRADREAHAFIARHLSTVTPYPILSEEGKHLPFDERKEWNTFWLVDPLDGTKEFIKRNGEFTVNIALVRYGSPVAGVVYVPATDTLYLGAEEEGAYKVEEASKRGTASWEAFARQGKRLPLDSPHDGYVIVVSRSHPSPETEMFIEKARRDHPHVHTVPSGSSIKICLVAEGTADAYPRLAPTMEWDTAGGDAVVRAAGGSMVEAGSGIPLTYNKEDLHNPSFIVHCSQKSQPQ